MANGLPKRLAKDPILEAVCEFRFAGVGVPASGLLPGILSSQFRAVVPKFEALPANSIPDAIRRMDAAFRHAPLHRLAGDDYAINIGDHVISISTAARKYPGWTEFRPFVLSVIDTAVNSGVLGAIERMSVKFINLLQADNGGKDVASATNLVVQFGGHSVLDQPLQVRGEIRNGNLVTVVQVASQATVTLASPSNESLTGIVLDVDTIWQGGEIKPPHFAQILDAAHDEEKRVFFSLLTEAALTSMEPQYD